MSGEAPTGPVGGALLDEATSLLVALIRNRCVNDGSPDSGHEVRSATLLGDMLEDAGLATRRFEPHPGRVSMLAWGERRPDRPSLLLVGHTDVVPANAERWSVEPFAGEVIDGEVWGRGAVDMLSSTATMALAVRELARSGDDPGINVGFLAVADEEAGGRFGARWITEHEQDAVRAEWIVTESGGFPFPRGEGVVLEMFTGEKGAARLLVEVRGRAGHAAYSEGRENALIRAGEVLRRLGTLEPVVSISPEWRAYSHGMFDEPLARRLTDVAHAGRAWRDVTDDLAEHAYASTHMTIHPTVVRGSFKANVIPDKVELVLDVRTLPGQSGEDARLLVEEALSDLDHVDVRVTSESPPSQSPSIGPLASALAAVSRTLYPTAQLLPATMTAATDARFFRRIGATAYGFGLYSPRIPAGDYFRMIHGVDERIDIESLGYLLRLWQELPGHLGQQADAHR